MGERPLKSSELGKTKKQEIVKDKKFIPVVHSSSPAARSYFNSNYERYEWHMQNGCMRILKLHPLLIDLLDKGRIEGF